MSASSRDVLLSVVLPTIGRMDGLERALRSIQLQPCQHVETVVVGDTHSGPLPDVERLVKSFGRGYRYAAHDAGYHAVGHPQRNYGARLARGRWLCWMADDDIFTQDAFASILAVVESIDRPRPVLFRIRMMQYGGWVAWDRPRLAEGYIDAECWVVPNDPAKLGTWTDRYEGDFDFIRSTVDLYGGDKAILWRPELIAVTRPTPEQDWTRLKVEEAVTA